MAKVCDWCPINNCFVCDGHCGLCEGVQAFVEVESEDVESWQ